MHGLILALILAATPAWAQLFSPPHDPRMPITTPIMKGNEPNGTVTTYGNRMYFRNLKGELIATVVTARDGTRTTYDPNGKIMEPPK